MYSETKRWPMGYRGVWCIFGTWSYNYQTIQEIFQDPGVEIIGVFDKAYLLKAFQKRGLTKGFWIDETWAIEQIVAKILSLHQQKDQQFCAAVCFHEVDLLLANQLNEALASHELHSLTVRPMIEKASFYQKLKDANLFTALFDTWTYHHELAFLVASGVYQQGNYILKPSVATGSFGVYRSAPDEHVEASIRNYQALFEQSNRVGFHLTPLYNQRSIIMEYIDYAGVPIEITADGIVKNGKVTLHVIQEKIGTVPFPPFIDRKMVSPPVSPLIANRCMEIEQMTQQIFTVLAIPQCVFHLEYRLTEQECIPIDISLRPGGGFIPHAVYQLTGIDLYLAHIESHLPLEGKERTYPGIVQGGTCIGAFYASSTIDKATFHHLIQDLQKQQEGIFAFYTNKTFILDPVSTLEASASLGVCAPTSAAALSRFDLLSGVYTDRYNEREMHLTHSSPHTMHYEKDIVQESVYSSFDVHRSTRPLHRWFEEQATKMLDSIAVVYEGNFLTYKELNQRANQLAHRLQRLGVGPDILVGVYVERSLELIITLLAILKAGGAYVPLDPALPSERLSFILDDACVRVLITQKMLEENILEKGAYKVIYVENEYSALDREEPTTPYGEITSESLAYVIYTSGSTGQPKGAMVTHSNVMSLFQVTPSLYSFNEKDVWTLFHSYAFDFSVWEIWGALLYGGRLVVVPYTTSRSPEAFYHLLCTEYVTVLNQTPSAFRQLMLVDQAEEKGVTLSLRLIIFGGETLNFQSLQPWFERHGEHNPQLVNMYGITETTILNTYKYVTFKDVIESKGSVIGKPLSNTYIYLLDQDLQKVASGIPGELYIGGACVSRGYVNREVLTQKCFIRDPFSISSSARLYRSGDIARYLDDGTLEYLGRIDNQVKIRGFRVELEEIEILLSAHTHIQEAVVLVHEDMLAEKRLVAYLTTDNAIPTVSDLRISLKQQLPEYMIPSLFMFLDSFPLTVNGKIDRQALPIPDWSLREHEVIPATPCNPTEERLISIWSQVLGLDQIDIHDDFFDLGGDSLSAIYTVSLIRKTLTVPVEHHLFFDAPTIAEQAKVIIKMIANDLND